MEIKQLLLLVAQGWSNRKIADHLGMSRNTVNGYVTLFKNRTETIEELLTWSEDQLQSLFSPIDQRDLERYTDLEGYFPEVLKSSRQVGFTLQKMWEKYRQERDDGYGYTQFVAHYHRWNSKSDVTLKLDHKAGESLMADYTGKKLHWVNKQTGELNEVEVFVGTLPASGYTFVEATESQGKDHFIGNMVNFVNYIGGVPQVAIPDNLKSAVSKASKYEAITNRTFRDLADHYGMVLNPTRPYRPKDKAHVERTVQLVYEQIFFPMRDEVFFSLHELNERIAELLEKFNDRKYSQLNISRKELFLTTEYPMLKPLPPEPYQIKHFKRAKVQKNTYVYLSSDKHYYSVPYRYIGKRVQIHYSERMVEIFYNHQRIGSHLRDRTASGYTTKEDHLPSKHQFYRSWSPNYFIQKAGEIGLNTTQYIQRLFNQEGHVETKYKTAMGIVQLPRQYTLDRIEKACQLAHIHPVSSYQRVLSILEKGLDQLAPLFDHEPPTASHIPPHSNIRGATYYSDN